MVDLSVKMRRETLGKVGEREKKSGGGREKIIFKWNGERNKEFDAIHVNNKLAKLDVLVRFG